MKLFITTDVTNATTLTINTSEEYVTALKMIDSCIARNISVSISTTNAVIKKWLVTMYQNQCEIVA